MHLSFRTRPELRLRQVPTMDINAGIFVDDEAEQLMWLVELAQEAVNLPLFIDSPDPAVIKNAILVYRKKPMINSLTLESSRLEGRK